MKPNLTVRLVALLGTISSHRPKRSHLVVLMTATAIQSRFSTKQNRRARLAKNDLDAAIDEAVVQHPDI